MRPRALQDTISQAVVPTLRTATPHTWLHLCAAAALAVTACRTPEPRGAMDGESPSATVRLGPSGGAVDLAGVAVARVGTGVLSRETEVTVAATRTDETARDQLLALAEGLGVPFETLAAGMRAFDGVVKRQEVKGEEAGVLVIDDFGRQLVPPASLLNRWIVPLENRIDYLTLHTGQSFAIPFEELLIFSTNLHPEDLMDPAFLRRLPYKFEIGAPDRASYRSIFERVCRQENIVLTDEIFDSIVHRIMEIRRLGLAAYQPRFIIDQIVATCRFLQQPAHFEQRFIDYAVDNLAVRRAAPHPAASNAGQHNRDG